MKTGALPQVTELYEKERIMAASCSQSLRTSNVLLASGWYKKIGARVVGGEASYDALLRIRSLSGAVADRARRFIMNFLKRVSIFAILLI